VERVKDLVQPEIRTRSSGLVQLALVLAESRARFQLTAAELPPD